ncbi:MAG: IclR family transcriptional regulator [Clostridia bacterium]|nr:IclR family transcriptional regulator [Clostridia bacterium]
MSRAPAVDYALEIIEFFASKNSEIGIADISNALNINKNAVSRVLEALLEKNWIYMSDSTQKKYRLTLRPFSLISGYINNNSIAKIATPYIEQLNKELGDSVYLGVKNGKNVLYLIHCDSTKEVRINGCAGGEYPLNCSAPGKILLSYSDTEEIKNYFNIQVDKRTTNTITDFDSFMIEADKIKKAGFAIDNEEFAKGIICIAVPIFDYAGNVVATIGISSLTLYDDTDSLICGKFKLLKNIADEVSQNLGNSEKAGAICE